MVVLIDLEGNKVRIYGNDGLQEFEMTDVVGIEEAIGSANVYYITSAVEVNAQDIINLLASLSGKYVYENEDEDDGVKYFKSNMNGAVIVPDPFATGDNIKNSLIRFDHKNDCRVYDQSLVDKSPMLRVLLQQKKIEIIGRKQMKKAVAEYQKENIKKIKKQKDIEDKQLADIIIDGPVDKFMDSAGSIFNSSDDIDTSESIGDVMEETEEAKLIKQMGLGKKE